VTFTLSDYVDRRDPDLDRVRALVGAAAAQP
jgi:hypothetical protein